VPDSRPLILYVPGLMPKPPDAVHRQALAASLAAGLDAIDMPPDAAGEGFDVYSWTYGFYRQHRDYALDEASIDALLARPEATAADIRDASTPGRRLQKALFRIGNALPVLIPHFATDRQRLHVRDLNRYADNRDGSATTIREGLKSRLRSAAGRPLLLIGHSMGSVICWDTLWEAAFDEQAPIGVSLFLTMGSPLGQRYVQQRLLSYRERAIRRFPPGIERWVNLAAEGDMTSLDQRLANDFARRYPEASLEIEDYEVVNAFRLDGVLNPHAEYGYLANPVTARLVAEWWTAATRDCD
jgi:hypothetical protein